MREYVFRIAAVTGFVLALAVPQASAQIAMGNGAEGDSFLHFYEDGSVTGEALLWDDSADMFTFSDDVVVTGMLATNDTQISINFDGPNADSALYFFDGNSNGRYLLWDHTLKRFEFNGVVNFGKNIIVGTPSNVMYNLFGADASPDSGSITSSNDILAHELELDGPLYLSRILYMEGDVTNPSEADQVIYFANAGVRANEDFRWDTSVDRFSFSDGLQIEESIIVGSASTSNILYNLFGVDASPDSGSITADSDILASDLELDGTLFLSKTLYMEGNSGTTVDGDQYIFFYDQDAKYTNFFKWDDVRTDSACSSTVPTDSAFVFNIGDNTNSGWLFTNDTDIEFKMDTLGDMAIDGTLVQSGSCDLAETFIGPDLEPGTVVVLDLAVPEAVQESQKAYDATSVGVVSTRPGVLLNGPTTDAYPKFREIEETKALYAKTADPTLEVLMASLELELDGWTRGNLPVALAGRVPVKVDGSFGAIRPGDFLTTSSTRGHAMVLDRPGPAIGVALEGFSGERGTVLMMLQPGWHGGAVARDGGVNPEMNSVGDGRSSAQGVDFAAGTTLVRQTGSQPVVGDVGLDALRAIGESLAGFQPVIESVEAGDVLVADRTYEGWLRRSEMGADSAVVGIVTETNPAVMAIVTNTHGAVFGDVLERFAEVDEQLFVELEAARAAADDGALQQVQARLQQQFEETFAPVATSGIVRCKVDASYAAIGVGDLLSTSPTPGHAMRAEAATPGTILGKALESMDNGTGAIRVLVMLR